MRNISTLINDYQEIYKLNSDDRFYIVVSAICWTLTLIAIVADVLNKALN